MKKLITGLVLGALCCMLFSTPAFPTKYDPSRPPPTPTINIGDASSNGDDIAWGEPLSSSGHNGDWPIIGLFDSGFYPISVIWIRFIIKHKAKGESTLVIEDDGHINSATSDPYQGSSR